jgi:transposase
MPRPVALDHNFPEPILACVTPWLPEVELAWVRSIGPGLGDVEDHELIYALREHGYPVLVTNNWKMENDARVLVALERTRMSLLTLKKAGDDAIFATGVLLRDLVPLLSTHVPRGQIFRASPSRIQPRRALALLERVAEQQGTSAEQLLRDLSP